MLGSGLLMTSSGGPIEYVGGVAKSKDYDTDFDLKFTPSDISGLQNGDLLILAYSRDVSDLYTPTKTWTTDYNIKDFDGTSTVGLFYTTVDGSTFPFTLEAAASTDRNEIVAVLMAFRNASFVSATTTHSDTSIPPAVTASEGSAVVVLAHGQDEALTPIAPSGYSNLVGDNKTSTVGSQTIAFTAMASKLGLSDGTETPGQMGREDEGDPQGSPWSNNFMRCTSILLE